MGCHLVPTRGNLARQPRVFIHGLSNHKGTDPDLAPIKQVKETRNTLSHAILKVGVRRQIRVARLDRLADGTTCARDGLSIGFKHHGDGDGKPGIPWPERRIYHNDFLLLQKICYHTRVKSAFIRCHVTSTRFTSEGQTRRGRRKLVLCGPNIFPDKEKIVKGWLYCFSPPS